MLDVAIVGLGPVGATVAAMLAQRGLTVAVWERETGVYHMPRAAHFDAEIMRVWQELGITEALAGCTTEIGGMHLVNAEGRKLVRFDASKEIGPHGWADGYLFYQPELETALRARARELGVDVHLGWEVEALDADAEGASLEVRHRVSGRRESVRARWVLGCDGARSITRAAIGTRLEDLCCDQPWLVIDAILGRSVDLPEVAVQYCDPARPATFIPMPGRRRRWEFMLMPGDTREGMERPERIRELLAPWVAPGDVEIERAVVYSFHALVAAPWRRGPVFVLGDAAHQMPPFLGQGMCSGVRDAANLAWKLELVRRGRATDAILDTYESERSPHVRAVIDLAVRTGGIIQTTDREVAAARDRHFLSADAPALAQTAMPPLAGGVLHRAGQDPAAGQMFPQPLDERGRRFDDALGRGFAVVAAADPRRALGADSLGWWEALGARFVTTAAFDGWLAAHGARAAVVRPDRYVFGVARELGDLEGLTRDLRARLGA